MSDEQRLIDFRRADQLRILRDCELTRFAAKDGKVVTPAHQKAMLRTLDDHGRTCFASLDTLAKQTGLSRRHVVRVLEVLLLQGLIAVQEARTSRGYPRVHRVVVFSELALRCSDELAAKFGRVKVSGPSAPWGTEPSAPGAEPSAPGAEPSAPGAEPSAPEGQPSAPWGTLNELNATRSAHEAPTRNDQVVSADGARRNFSEQQLAAIRAKANTLQQRAQATSPDDRELLLKIATLWEDGRICEDAIQQVLESYQRKREQGDPVQHPISWLWGTLRNQCRVRGHRLERLLATTDFPLDVPPVESPPNEDPPADLQAAFGAEVERLTPEQILALADEMDAGRAEYVRQKLRKEPHSPLLKELLASWLAQRQASSQSLVVHGPCPGGVR